MEALDGRIMNIVHPAYPFFRSDKKYHNRLATFTFFAT